MPIYEYQCAACGQNHEAIQKLSDAPLTCCPHCDAEALSKQISAPGFRLSGNGWYETDFKTGNKKNLAGNDAAGSSKAASKAKSKASGSGGE